MKWVRRVAKSRRVWCALPAILVASVVVGIAGWWLLPPLDPAPYLDPAASGQLRDRDGQRLYVALSAEETWSLPQPDDGFSPYLREATLAAEDQRFYGHYGVDPLAIARAVGQNLRHAGIASGASTLTMQLVKLGGHDSASLTGKVGQAIGALRLEKSLEKAEILRAYLNRAPYGMNLIGAEAAAWRYFGKSAQTLSLPEAALLAGLPKAPSRLNPLEHPERARIRRDYVLRRMSAEGFISESARDEALAAPIRASWHDFPRVAPHLGAAYREELAQGRVIDLALDATLQASLEDYLPYYLKRFNNNIGNGAILVVDVQTGALLARVASAGFSGVPGGGEVDACQSVRSPGSTLKPFLFGLAMARQQLYPTEVLLDDILDYGRYAPGNFDGFFNGPVTATEALRFSLNVPAVALLHRVGVADFHTFLREGGLTSIDKGAAHYGLGLALGNCEVSLEALSQLYLSVASLGKQNALQLRKDTPAAPASALFTPEVARTLYDMLEQPFPDDLDPRLQRREGNDAPVCWKTGTSTGYHDAWTFAFNQHYLVGVWLGNNDGRGVRQLVGGYAALPLAAHIIRDLPAKAGPVWPPVVPSSPVTLCAASGLPANDECPETQVAQIADGLWRHRRCALHTRSQTGLTVVAARPVQATAWDLAALAPEGERSMEATGPALAITSPVSGAAFVLSGVADGDLIPLKVTAELLDEVHWFMDGKYLGARHDGEVLLWPLSAGEHRVAAQLADGRVEQSTFTVLRPSELSTTP